MLDPVLAGLNCILCLWRFFAALRNGRPIAIAWFLMVYFSIFFLPVSVTSEISWYRGFPGLWAKADHVVIHKVIVYLVLFNLIFAFAEKTLSLLLGLRGFSVDNWRVEIAPQRWSFLRAVLGVLWLVGGAWYIWQTRSSGYRDYVEGASWAMVVFWASSPLVVLAAMRREWLLATVLCVPFMYFAVHLSVRSFALLSLVPMLVVGFFQATRADGLVIRFWKMFRYMALAGLLLVAVSIYVSQHKTGEFGFPDSGMPFGFVETAAMVDQFDKHVGFSGLQLYGWNYINPFMRLIGLSKPAIADTPTVIAELLDGVPENWPVYFHYPALLWTDAYISFGWAGLWLAVFWAAALTLWECAMRRNPFLMSLLLPFFCWHGYMLVRGAIAVASVPLSYAAYISLIAYLAALRMDVFRASAGQHPTQEAMPVADAHPFHNLMA